MSLYTRLESLGRRCLHIAFRGRVQAGPFRGMRYSTTSYGGWYPKIFGSYEYKVQEWLIARLKAIPQPTFWDIGAAEGFYAIGAALNNAKVVAWEGESPQRATIHSMAQANAVASRIELRDFCTSEELMSRLKNDGPPDILIMDVEGYETTLITEHLLRKCTKTAFLIELHGDEAIKHVKAVFESAEFPGYMFDHDEWSVDQWPYFHYIPSKIRHFLLKERRSPGGNPYYVFCPTEHRTLGRR